MRDQQGRDLQLGQQGEELTVQRPPRRVVQRGERLVQKQHLRAGDQRPGEGDPLLLPP